jgi:serine/threonine protein kinase
LDKDYERVKEITERVELYRHRITGESVAVKSFGFGKGKESQVQEYFMREIESQMRLVHDCILKLKGYCLSREKEGLKLVTEFLEGKSLKSVLEDPQKVEDWWTNTRKAITIVGIVLAMRKIHSHGIIHRDLKPANIFLAKDFEVKIGDLGSSRVYESITMAKAGTPLYMAPEVSYGQYGPACDVYSFGLILYGIVVGNELLSGPGRKTNLFIDLQLGKRPKIPTEVVQVSRDLIERCWSQEAASRPSFDEILRILEKNNFEVLTGVEVGEVRKFISKVEMESKLKGNLAKT